MKWAAGAFAALAFNACGWAQSATSTQVGSTTIVLPAPLHSIDPSHRAPKLKNLLERSTIAQKRFLAGFVSHEDVEAAEAGRDPELSLYYAAHTWRAAELTTVSPATFEATKQIIRDQFKTLAPQTAAVLSQLLESLLEGGASAQTRVSPVAVFDETPSSISVTSINTSVITSGNTTVNDSVIVSATTMHVRGKYIYLQVCSDLRRAADVLENQEASRAWVRAVIAANQ